MDNLYTNQITLGNMQSIGSQVPEGGNLPPMDSDISDDSNVGAEDERGGNVKTDLIKTTGGEADKGDDDDSENNNTLLYILLGGLALFLLRKKL